MATLSFILDKNRRRADGSIPLRLQIINHGKNTLFSFDVFLTDRQWNARQQKVINHPNASVINSLLSQKRYDFEAALFNLEADGMLRGISSAELRKRVMAELYPEESKVLFVDRWKKYESQSSPATRKVYGVTWKKICEFADDAESMAIDGVDVAWLRRFEKYLKDEELASATRELYLRNISAVVNDAYNEDVIVKNPFAKFSIEHEDVFHDALNLEQIRLLFNADLKNKEVRNINVFKLMFCLIGINLVDLVALKAIKNGRIDYRRSKTKRLYSIKVEPEAAELLELLKGEEWLVFIMDKKYKYKSYLSYSEVLNYNVKKVAKRVGIEIRVTPYTARRSWATIAHSLGISKDVISLALGHSFGVKVTDSYINYDLKKIDEANRKVLDAVFGKVEK